MTMNKIHVISGLIYEAVEALEKMEPRSHVVNKEVNHLKAAYELLSQFAEE